METIRGKASLDLDLHGLRNKLTNYQRVVLDLGTGDGRYVRYLAVRDPGAFVIGMDSCRENLREHSRTKLNNTLFIIAQAQQLPHELHGLISHITINFPWGSLLKSLVENDSALLHGLCSIARSDTQIEIQLNGGALAELGTTLEHGTACIHKNMDRHGWKLSSPSMLGADELKNVPTTWARRLAHGRDPRAMTMRGYLPK